MSRWIAISLFVVLTVSAAASHAAAQALYKPGSVRSGVGLRAPLDPPEQPSGSEFWLVETDVRLFHESRGDSKGKAPDILVIHGGPGYPMKAPVPGLAPFEGNHRVHFYHQRGCGKSSRPVTGFESADFGANVPVLDKALGLGAQVADIERIRRILGQEKLILVGHSFGGFIASLYAAEFPERVEGLILVAPATVLVMPNESGNLFQTIQQRLPASMQGEWGAFMGEYFNFGSLFSKKEPDLAALNRRFAKYFIAAVGEEGDMAKAASATTDFEGAGGWMVFAMYFSMGMTHDFRDPLKAVTAPVLVMHGAEDLQSEAASRSYVDCFPNASFEVVKEAGHFPFVERPDEFSRIVGEFLTENPMK